MAAKQLNKKLVLALSVAAAMAMVVLAVLMVAQLRSAEPEKLVELAEQAQRMGQWEQAGIFYQKAYQRTRDAQYLVRLGEMVLNDGNINQAIASWREATVVDPNLLEAHRKQVGLFLELARLYGGVQRWLQLKERAERLLATEGDTAPGDLAAGHHALGMALCNLASQDATNPAQGLASLQRAVALAPDNADFAIDLAAQLLADGQTEQGLQDLQTIMQAHDGPGPAAARVRRVYAAELAGRDEPAQAEELFKQAIELAGGNQEAVTASRVAYGSFLAQQWAAAVRDEQAEATIQQRFEAAESVLRRAMEADPNAYEPPYRLSLLYEANREFQKVIDVCERRLAGEFKRAGVESARNLRYVFLLNIRASTACTAMAARPEVAAERDEWLVRAEQYLADARGEERNHPVALAQEGRIRIAQGRDRAALEALRAAEQAFEAHNRLDWNNKITLAKLHLKLHEPGAARDVLEGVGEEARNKRNTDLDYWITYARTMFDLGEYDACLTITNRVLTILPDHDPALLLKAAALERKGMTRQASAIAKDESARAILEAKQLAIEGNVDLAVDVLRGALRDDPGQPILLRALVGELVMRNQMGEAAALVQQGLEANPDSAALKALSVWVKPDLTPEEQDRRLLEIIEFEEDDYRRTLDLVVFRIRQQEYETAIGLIDEALRLRDERATPFAQRATIAHARALVAEKLRLAAQLDDTAAQQAARDYAIAHDVDGAGGQTIVGLYHMYREEWELAINALSAAISLQGTDTRALTHLGQCHLMKGNLDDAAIYLQRAVNINPNEPLAHRGLGRLAQLHGNTAEFKHHLSICARLLPNDPWVRSSLEAQRDLENPNDAITRREALLANDPDNEYNLRRLALLSEQIGDRQRGDRYHDRLLELAPNDPELVFAVSAYYRRTDRPERALQIVRTFAAGRQSPEATSDAQVLVARHLIDDGRRAEAESTLLSAADNAITLDVAKTLAAFYLRYGSKPDKSLTWFDKAVEIARQGNEAELSSVMAARIEAYLDRRINKLADARKAVKELRAAFPKSVDGLLLHSEVESRSGNVAGAIDALGRYLEELPEDVTALFQRARFLIAQGRLAAAIADLEAIKRISPVALEMAPRFTLAELHRQAGRTAEWVAELESLVDDSDGDTSAVEALVAAYMHAGRLADADQLVTSTINDPNMQAPARLFALRARVSDRIGDPARALDDYERAARLQEFAPKAVADVLAGASRLGKLGLGIEYFERYAATAGEHPLCLSWYGTLLAQDGRTEDAVRAFRRAMARAVEGTIADRVRVTQLVRTAFPQGEALALFQRTPAEPEYKRANHRIRLRLMSQVDRLDEAVMLADELIRTAPTDAERGQLLEERGDLHSLSGNITRARESYEEALKYNDRNWVLLNNLAFLLADKLDNPQVARPYAERAVAVRETSFTLDTLGWIYTQLEQYDTAIAELNRALRLDPNSAESAYHLGEALRRNRQFSEAGTVLRRAEELAMRAGDDTISAQVSRALEQVQSRDSSH